VRYCSSLDLSIVNETNDVARHVGLAVWAEKLPSLKRRTCSLSLASKTCFDKFDEYAPFSFVSFNTLRTAQYRHLKSSNRNKMPKKRESNETSQPTRPSGRDLDQLEKARSSDNTTTGGQRSLRIAIVTENFLPKWVSFLQLRRRKPKNPYRLASRYDESWHRVLMIELMELLEL